MAKMKELSWSLSRARMFEECPRRFYYNFYLAPQGYSQDSPEEAKRAYEMKLIKSLDMWVGEVVHQTIQWMLEQARVGTITSADAARADVHQRLKDGWKGSKE
ncbi:MAG: PD-(D/E)XK nuclease family protein, partial [Armatimonadota bacterium]|nr:PD-(D/E)XK nuclease family protein [Armatimonadota bacterium]